MQLNVIRHRLLTLLFLSVCTTRTVIMPPAGPPTRPRAAVESAAAPTEATRNFPPTNGSDQLQGLLQGEMGVLLTGSMRSALEAVLERFTATAAEREAAQVEFRRLLDQAL